MIPTPIPRGVQITGATPLLKTAEVFVDAHTAPRGVQIARRPRFAETAEVLASLSNPKGS